MGRRHRACNKRRSIKRGCDSRATFAVPRLKMAPRRKSKGTRRPMVITVNAYKIAYMALPKAGCSTVKAALAMVDPDVSLPPPEARDVHAWHRIYPTSRWRPYRWERCADHWRFCVVRDPLRRLLSVYTNRVVGFGDLHDCRKILRGKVDLPKDPDPDFFFQNLRRYMRASSLIKHHALPSWLFLGFDLGSYDRIYRSSELGQFGQDLGQRTGRCVPIERENRSEARLDLEDLAARTQDSIRAYLAEEYDYLSAFYQNPFSGRRTVPCAARLRRVS